MIGETRLVKPSDPPAALTQRQETDATTALTRGLAEYLRQLEIDWAGSRIAFAKATDTWADYEDTQGDYPRAFVGTVDAEGAYDGGLGEASFSTKLAIDDGPLEASGSVVLDSFEELVVPVTVEINCCNPEERRAVCVMIESACRPFRNRSGFALELPHYFNARSTHTAVRIAYMDNEEDASRNYRKAKLVIQSRIPVIVLHRLRPVREIRRTSTVTASATSTTAPSPTVSVGK